METALKFRLAATTSRIVRKHSIRPETPFFGHFVMQAGFLTMERGYHGLPSEKFDKFGDDLIRRFFH